MNAETIFCLEHKTTVAQKACPKCVHEQTILKLAEVMNFDKGWELQQMLWEDLENAVNGSNFSTTEDDIVAALHSLLDVHRKESS